MHHNCPFFHDESLMPEDLRTALEEELELFFLGKRGSAGELQHNRLPETYRGNNEPYCGSSAEQTPSLPLSRNRALKMMISNISTLAGSVRRCTEGNMDVSRRIAHDLVQRVGNLFNDSNEIHALQALEGLRKKMSSRSPVQCYHLTKSMGISDSDGDIIFSMLEDAAASVDIADTEDAAAPDISPISARPPTSATSAHIQRQSLEHAMEQNISRNLSAYEAGLYRSIIRSNLPPIIIELLENAALLSKVSENMEHYFGINSAGWDYTRGEWQEIPWEIFNAGRQLLENDPSIMRLAEILGRGSGAGRADTVEMPDQKETEHIHEQEYLGKREILGINFGNDINITLPSQFMFFFDSDTEYRFYKELLEGQLLVLHYRNMETREKIIYRPKKQKKTLGPVIICLDTSGSMSGWPESVAKALCLALVHICRRMRRGLYLILFSTEVREMDLSNMEESIGEFSQFFRMEFRGGTDLRPALRASLRVMREKDFVDSDLLIISDFRVPKIMLGDDIVFSGIREHNRIHALTIGKQPMEDIFNIFDSCWHYLVSAQGQAIGMGGI